MSTMSLCGLFIKNKYIYFSIAKSFAKILHYFLQPFYYFKASFTWALSFKVSIYWAIRDLYLSYRVNVIKGCPPEPLHFGAGPDYMNEISVICATFGTYHRSIRVDSRQVYQGVVGAE